MKKYIVTQKELYAHRELYFEKIRAGAIFIYPTDTIYGIGCIATNSTAIKKIQKIKQRTTPFSVIVPSKTWIKKNCVINKHALKWLNKLPGKYTLILPLKNNRCSAQEVNQKSGTLGVRIPNHWVSSIARALKKPIITTSVNVHEKKPMTSLKDLDIEIIKKVDFIMYEGVNKGKPSTIVKLLGKGCEVIKR